MKKLVFSLMAVTALGFTSCGSDDDSSDDNSSECVICELTEEGITTDSEICENGDGSFTISSEGSEITFEESDGITFDQFIDALEDAGASCN